MPKLLSIITPSFNHASYIRQTIESVLAQDYPAVEHIVVDGGSTDGTVEILREYGARHPDRFRWVSEPDRGQSHAFNKGLAMACGEFIGWQNSDDYYYPNVFAEAIRYLMAHPEAAAVYSDLHVLDADGSLVPQPWAGGAFDLGRLLDNNFIANQTAFFRRDALVTLGGVDEDRHYAMDYDLYLRLGLRFRLTYLPGLRGVWRELPTVKTVAGLTKALTERVEIIEWVLKDPLLPANLVRPGMEAFERHVFSALLESLLAGEDMGAIAMVRRAFGQDGHVHQWRHLYRSLVIHERMASYWSGMEDDQAAASTPARLLRLLHELGYGRSPEAAALATMASLSAIVRHGQGDSLRRATSSLVRLVVTDPSGLAYLGSLVLLCRLCRDEPRAGMLRRAIVALQLQRADSERQPLIRAYRMVRALSGAARTVPA